MCERKSSSLPVLYNTENHILTTEAQMMKRYSKYRLQSNSNATLMQFKLLECFRSLLIQCQYRRFYTIYFCLEGTTQEVMLAERVVCELRYCQYSLQNTRSWWPKQWMGGNKILDFRPACPVGMRISENFQSFMFGTAEEDGNECERANRVSHHSHYIITQSRKCLKLNTKL